VKPQAVQENGLRPVFVAVTPQRGQNFQALRMGLPGGVRLADFALRFAMSVFGLRNNAE
jgi:hypothetical protein